MLEQLGIYRYLFILDGVSIHLFHHLYREIRGK